MDYAEGQLGSQKPRPKQGPQICPTFVWPVQSHRPWGRRAVAWRIRGNAVAPGRPPHPPPMPQTGTGTGRGTRWSALLPFFPLPPLPPGSRWVPSRTGPLSHGSGWVPCSVAGRRWACPHPLRSGPMGSGSNHSSAPRFWSRICHTFLLRICHKFHLDLWLIPLLQWKLVTGNQRPFEEVIINYQNLPWQTSCPRRF